MMFSKIFSPLLYKMFYPFFTQLSPSNTVIHYHEVMVKFLLSCNSIDVQGKSRKRFIISHEGIDCIFPVTGLR